MARSVYVYYSTITMLFFPFFQFLPPYVPSEEEKSNPTIFAQAVRSQMAQ